MHKENRDIKDYGKDEATNIKRNLVVTLLTLEGCTHKKYVLHIRIGHGYFAASWCEMYKFVTLNKILQTY